MDPHLLATSHRSHSPRERWQFPLDVPSGRDEQKAEMGGEEGGRDFSGWWMGTGLEQEGETPG